MKKNTNFSRIFKTYLAALLAFMSFFCLILPVSAQANSAPPEKADNGSGIVFKQHEHVQIEKEILNITVNDDLTAQIDATYTMKNTSNQALSVQTMFLSPVNYGQSKQFSITQDGTPLAFTQEFYALNHWYSSEQDIENWETVLANLQTPATPFGDGSGFFQYQFFSTGDNLLVSMEFSPTTHYFAWYDFSYSNKNGVVKITSTGAGGITILSRQDFSPTTNGTFTKTPIANVYDYLFQWGTQNGVTQDQQQFARQQFNAYLTEVQQSLPTTDRSIDFFRFDSYASYISAVTYDVEFLPNQTVTLAVSYQYQMGGSISGSNAEILYYLTPAKYWKDFADIEINLFLNEKYKILKNSTLEFEQIDEFHYRYTANSLPQHELRIELSTGKWSAFLILFVAMILIFGVVPLVIIAAIIIAILTKRSKIQKQKLLLAQQEAADDLPKL